MATGYENWQQIPIRENGESLISLRGVHPRIVVSPQYFLQKIRGASGDCFARETACQRLAAAAERLPGSLKLVIWDAWRSVEVQTQLYRDYRARVVAGFPGLEAAELDRRVAMFVSLPSASPTAPSPHNTGGAVDLSLVDGQDRAVPMGTAFDDFSPAAWSDYFEELRAEKPLTDEERTWAGNRAILRAAMEASGFVNYPCEWWHFDFGNQWWAMRTRAGEAVYGPASI